MHGVAGEGLGVEQLSCDDRTYSSPGVFDDGLAALCLRNWAEGARFESFVADGMGQPSPWQNLRDQVYLGSDRFVETTQQQIKDRQPLQEIPTRQKRRPAHP